MRSLESFLLLFVLLPLAASCSARSAPMELPSPEPLRALSFNIRYGTANDGEDHWLNRRENVVETIRSKEPDVIGLQEAIGFQVDFLSEHLPGYEVIGVGRDGGSGGEYSCLMIDRSRFETLRTGTFWLSEAPDLVASVGWDAALPRICTWAVLRERAGERDFLLMNSHFDHRGVEARERSGALIHSVLKDYPGLPVIVMGDFNAGEASAALKALKGDVLRDSFRVLHPGESVVGTFNGFRGQGDGQKIDYILCSKEWTVLTAFIDRREFDGHTPSDHYPVFAVLQL